MGQRFFQRNNPAVDPEVARLRRGLWVARLFYFGFFGSLGTLVPFFNVYLQERGLSGTEIGMISSLPPLISLIASPFWSAVADRWQAHQRVLALLALGTGVASLAFLWVDTFWSILVVLVALNLFRSPVSAILDGTVMGLVTRHQISYGKQRMWGSIGWITSGFAVGYAVTTWNTDIVFWVHAFTMGVLCTLLSLQLPVETSTQRIDYRAGLGQLIRLADYRALLVFMAMYGAGMAMNANFLSLHILQLGGTAALIGIANATNAIPEIPVMFVSDRWFRRVSFRTTIIIMGLGFAFTWALIGMATSAMQIPFITPLIGLFYGVGWIAVVGFANNSAPDGMRASAQGIAQAALSGPGWALGSFFSGILWDAAGGQAVFLVAATLIAFGAGVFALGTRNQVQVAVT